jgi:hypothetical protein
MNPVEQTVQIDMTDLASKPREVVEAMVDNCTTTIQVKFDFDPKDNGHTMIFGTTREGMSVAANQIQDHLIGAGGRVVIFDIGHSTFDPMRPLPE